jgi:hypothetical protein
MLHPICKVKLRLWTTNNFLMKNQISKNLWAALSRRAFDSGLYGAVAMMVLLLSAMNLSAAVVVTTLTGGPNSSNTKFYGYTDGETKLQAQFHTPVGLALDSSQSYLLVADRDNNAIRLLDLFEDQTFTFAVGSPISKPVGVLLDSDDNVYVLNRGTTNSVSTNGTVVEFDTYGDLIATNATGLTNATAMAMDSYGNIYVTVNTNKLIQISPGGAITTIATITNAGASLQGIVVMDNGSIAACDSGRNGILIINPSNTNTTSNAISLTGFNGPGDYSGIDNRGATSGSGPTHASFFSPSGVAKAGGGVLVVTDTGNNRVKVINVLDVTTNLYGVHSNLWYYGTSSTLNKTVFPGWYDGTVKVPDAVGDVESRMPVGIVVAGDSTVYVTEDYYHLIRHVTTSGLQAPTPPLPATPTILTVTTNYGQVSLTWSAVSGAISYNVKRSTSPNAETTITNVTSTSYTDTNVNNGTKYYYVVSALNANGEGANSAEVSATPPLPPVPAPQIGWLAFPPPNLTSVFQGGSSFIFNNDVPIVIEGAAGSQIFYTFGATTNISNIPNPTTSSFSAPVGYVDGLFPSLAAFYDIFSVVGSNPNISPDFTIEAIGAKNDGSPNSAIVSARFQFITANPTVSGNNAAQFTVSDVTSNALIYYTIDGSDPNPTNSASLGPISSGTTVSLNLLTNITFQMRAYHPPNYQPSGGVGVIFSVSDYSPNTISFGFASGEASSDFIASPGQTFYAPVTLEILPGVVMYSLQFNLTVTNAGSNPGPPIVPGAYDFLSTLVKPIPDTSPVVYETIPPYMFVGDETGPVLPSQLVTYDGTNFVNLEVADTNINLLAVGWLERFDEKNLYDTTEQDLIQYSQPHDTLFLQSGGQIVVGGYAFQVPTNALPGQTYQIQIGRPTATSDGIGRPGSSIFLATPTNGSLAGGAINSIKVVTTGQRKYIVGDAAPFRWFNAGDFGNTNLENADVEQVFQSAIYNWNPPLPGSDFFDAMDSCGNIGVLDGATGYYTNTAAYPYTFDYALNNYIYTYDINTNLISTVVVPFTNIYQVYIDTLSITAISTITSVYPTSTNVVEVLNTHNFPPNPYVPNLFDGNDQNINQIAFGDGQLDVCDVYVTYRRSLDPSLTWFSRFWTNGVRVAETTPNVYNPNVATKVSSQIVSKMASASTTNTVPPQVDFAAADVQGSAGQTIQVPITANIFGSYPLRVLMLNLTVVPLDDSPALTTPVSFTPNSGLGTPVLTDSIGDGNYAATWLDSTIAGFTGTVTIGTLTLTIPANATSLSAYAVHFDHASASPNGLASFPKQTLTGLVLLSSRTNSCYGDGIPDAWRLLWFGTTNNLLSVSNACPTGDGVNNWKKYVAGVDPNTPNDFPSVNPQTSVPSGSTSAIHWPTVSGKQYVIERSSSLFPGNWSNIATNTGTGGDMEFDDNYNGQMKFYRVLILP